MGHKLNKKSNQSSFYGQNWYLIPTIGLWEKQFQAQNPTEVMQMTITYSVV